MATARWKGHAELPVAAEPFGKARAPSTVLLRRTVPLPRFAGEDVHFNAYARQRGPADRAEMPRIPLPGE
jgi:hypothetical protein